MTVKKNFLDRFCERLENIDSGSRQAYILRLIRERGFLETVFNSIEEGILVIDRNLLIRYHNRAAQELLALPDDLSRLRVSQLLQGVDWRLLRDLPDGERLVREAQRLSGLDGEELRLWTTPASLAARALGLDEAAALRPENAESLRRATLALLACRAGLPGPLFISLQELTGALDVPRSVSRDILPSRGMVPLPGAAAGGGSVAPAPLAFGPLREQLADQDSFLLLTARLLLARQAAGLARGKLVSVQQAGGCLALCSTLPEGGCWLTVVNFSGQEREFSVQLPAEGDLLDIFSGQSLAAGRRLSLHLAARQSRHLVMDTHAASSAP